jgi:hypothetical protein
MSLAPMPFDDRINVDVRNWEALGFGEGRRFERYVELLQGPKHEAKLGAWMPMLDIDDPLPAYPNMSRKRRLVEAPLPAVLAYQCADVSGRNDADHEKSHTPLRPNFKQEMRGLKMLPSADILECRRAVTFRKRNRSRESVIRVVPIRSTNWL